ncbi:hypothetical protein A3Q56_08206, partial [Intoshia linei]
NNKYISYKRVHPSLTLAIDENVKVSKIFFGSYFITFIQNKCETYISKDYGDTWKKLKIQKLPCIGKIKGNGKCNFMYAKNISFELNARKTVDHVTYFSFDFGETWKVMFIHSIIGILPIRLHGFCNYVAYNKNIVLFTFDGARNWITLQKSPAIEKLTSFLFINSENVKIFTDKNIKKLVYYSILKSNQVFYSQFGENVKQCQIHVPTIFDCNNPFIQDQKESVVNKICYYDQKVLSRHRNSKCQCNTIDFQCHFDFNRNIKNNLCDPLNSVKNHKNNVCIGNKMQKTYIRGMEKVNDQLYYDKYCFINIIGVMKIDEHNSSCDYIEKYIKLNQFSVKTKPNYALIISFSVICGIILICKLLLFLYFVIEGRIKLFK